MALQPDIKNQLFCLFFNVPLQEESGLDDHEALDAYQQCLGELLLALAGR